MKNITTLTDYEILTAAQLKYLEYYNIYQEKYEQMPQNSIYEFKYKKFKAIYEELTNEICRIEREEQTNKHRP